LELPPLPDSQAARGVAGYAAALAADRAGPAEVAAAAAAAALSSSETVAEDDEAMLDDDYRREGSRWRADLATYRERLAQRVMRAYGLGT